MMGTVRRHGRHRRRPRSIRAGGFIYCSRTRVIDSAPRRRHQTRPRSSVPRRLSMMAFLGMMVQELGITVFPGCDPRRLGPRARDIQPEDGMGARAPRQPTAARRPRAQNVPCDRNHRRGPTPAAARARRRSTPLADTKLSARSSRPPRAATTPISRRTIASTDRSLRRSSALTRVRTPRARRRGALRWQPPERARRLRPGSMRTFGDRVSPGQLGDLLRGIADPSPCAFVGLEDQRRARRAYGRSFV